MTPYTRREFAKFAAALPVAGLLPALGSARAAGQNPAGKVNSKVRGVQIGLNVPYSFGNPAMNTDEVLAACVKLGVSGLELRTQPVEAWLGAPTNLVNARASVAAGGAAAANAEKLREWRRSAPVNRLADLRKQYEGAGVLIEIVKVDGIFRMSDAELDYVFGLAKALGARALSTEISKSEADHQRVGQFADKHRFPIGLHGHATTTPEHWEAAFKLAKFNWANVDLGHFVAGNNVSPIPFITQHHARISHVHVKDRRKQNGATTAFGEGDTPIIEVLRLIRDRGWPIQATIEFEYKFPATSDRMTEIAKTIQYCRAALA